MEFLMLTTFPTVDAQILIDAHHFTMDLPHLLRTALHGAIKPMITHCTLVHIRSLPQEISKPLLDLTRSHCELRRCGHSDEPLPTLACFLDCIDPKHATRPDSDLGINKHRYVVATQDGETRRKLREIPGTPLLYVKRSVLIMEPMAPGSMKAQEREEKGKFRAGLKAGRGEKRKRESNEDGEKRKEVIGEGAEDGKQEVVAKKKTKGPKGPHPLSVLRPKKRTKQNGQTRDSGGRKDEGQKIGADPVTEAGEQPKKKRKRKHRSGKVAKVESGAAEVSVEA